MNVEDARWFILTAHRKTFRNNLKMKHKIIKRKI